MDKEGDVVYWTNYQSSQRRQWMKTLHPMMLSERGCISVEGTKKGQSLGYGKGYSDAKPVMVLWDKEYALAKAVYELRPLASHPNLRDFLSAIASHFFPTDSLVVNETSNETFNEMSNSEVVRGRLDEVILKYEYRIANSPDSPRNKLCNELLKEIKGLL